MAHRPSLVTHSTMPSKSEEVADSSSERIAPSPLFFSLHSHRLVICLLLLFASYFSLANSMGMSTAVVCMVNPSLSYNRHEENAKMQTCPVQTHESMEDEFAIPGTMEWSPAQQSLLASARFYGCLITVAITGFVADRFGPDLVLIISLSLSSIITIASPLLAHANYNILLVSRFVIGAIESFYNPAINCLVARWFPAGEKHVAASIYSTGFQFAGGFSSLFAAFLCGSSLLGGWPSIFYMFGGASSVFTVVWLVFGYGGPAKNRWLREEERKYLIESIRGEKRSTPLIRILLSSAIHSIVICNFSFAFSASTMQAFLPLFLRQLGLSIDTVGWYTLSPFLFQIMGKAFLGPLVDYSVGREFMSLTMASKLTQTIGAVGSSVALMLLSIIPTCTNATSTVYYLIVYGFLYSGCTMGVLTSTLSISPANMGVISSLVAMSRIAGSVASTSIVNALIAIEVSYTWTLIFATAALFQCIGGIHFFIFGTTEEQSW